MFSFLTVLADSDLQAAKKTTDMSNCQQTSGCYVIISRKQWNISTIRLTLCVFSLRLLVLILLNNYHS